MSVAEQHIELVARLSKPGDDIVAQLDPDKAELLHAAIGVAGEAGELIEWAVKDTAQRDMENFIEELGDMEFFMQMARRVLGYSRDEIVTMAKHEEFVIAQDRVGCAALLSAHSCTFLDAVKKWAIYDAPANLGRMLKAMGEIEAAMAAFRMLHNVSREETLEHNIAKLNKRYQSGTYSNAEAQARADKAAS